MNAEFSNQAGSRVVDAIISTIKVNKGYLTEVDSHGGDGDHGINMNKGFTIAREELDKQPDYTMSEGLKVISQVLMRLDGTIIRKFLQRTKCGIQRERKDQQRNNAEYVEEGVSKSG